MSQISWHPSPHPLKDYWPLLLWLYPGWTAYYTSAISSFGGYVIYKAHVQCVCHPCKKSVRPMVFCFKSIFVISHVFPPHVTTTIFLKWYVLAWNWHRQVLISLYRRCVSDFPRFYNPKHPWYEIENNNICVNLLLYRSSSLQIREFTIFSPTITFGIFCSLDHR